VKSGKLKNVSVSLYLCMVLLFSIACGMFLTPNTKPDFPAECKDKRIAFSSNRDGNSEIYTMKLYDSKVTRLTNNSVYDGEPAWSPDGTKIAFTSTRDNNSDIYVMNADGSEQTRLTHAAANDADANWSPDGRRIAFVSVDAENSDIYTINPDGSGVTQLTISPAFDGGPVWSPDGGILPSVPNVMVMRRSM
jgi:Tol biopolymer transport system component